MGCVMCLVAWLVALENPLVLAYFTSCSCRPRLLLSCDRALCACMCTPFEFVHVVELLSRRVHLHYWWLGVLYGYSVIYRQREREREFYTSSARISFRVPQYTHIINSMNNMLINACSYLSVALRGRHETLPAHETIHIYIYIYIYICIDLHIYIYILFLGTCPGAHEICSLHNLP